MKKAYNKPVLRFEALSMGSGASGSCEAIANFSEGLCSITIDAGFEMNIYMDESICEWSTPDVYDMICYHAPSDDNNVFSS